jgi:hypothetical protein
MLFFDFAGAVLVCIRKGQNSGQKLYPPFYMRGGCLGSGLELPKLVDDVAYDLDSRHRWYGKNSSLAGILDWLKWKLMSQKKVLISAGPN